jgi:hypothetical protein
MVHVILCATLGSLGDRLCSLTLGANEENAATLCNRVANLDECLVQQRDRLGQVHDVDAGTVAIDELLHLRVPAVGLVTEVDASLKQLTHRELGKSHV